MTYNDLTNVGVADLAMKIQHGDLTSLQLTAALIAKIEQLAGLNAFIEFDAERARALASASDQRKTGRLRGIPLVVKDNIEVSGMQHTAGTPGLLGYIPASSAGVIEALEAEGAFILGKTNMHELAFGITSNNSHFGAVGNPAEPSCFAGGSSGGTAAAVAAGMAPAGLGTDTGGSARIPAALTGISGFRPTTGRYSATGITPISATRDTVGIMARAVGDIAMLDSVLAGAAADAKAKSPTAIRLGVPDNYFYDNLELDVRTVTASALESLTKAGITLIPIPVTERLMELNDGIGFPLVLHEIKGELESYLSGRTGGYVSFDALVASITSPDVAATFAGAVGTIDTDTYRQALDVLRPELQRLYAEMFSKSEVDGLIFPTTPLTARPIAGSDETVTLNGAEVNTFLTYIRNTDPSSNAGIPSISLRSGYAGKLPIGIQVDGRAGEDVELLGVARAIEEVLG